MIKVLVQDKLLCLMAAKSQCKARHTVTLIKRDPTTQCVNMWNRQLWRGRRLASYKFSTQWSKEVIDSRLCAGKKGRKGEKGKGIKDVKKDREKDAGDQNRE